MDKELDVTDEIQRKFNITCKCCNESNVKITFWTGGNGDTGFLSVMCEKTKQEINLN